MVARIVNYIFKVIECVLFLGLCFIAGYFMKDVVYKYQANDTYLGQSLKPITKLPTITFCADHKHHQFKINQDITISYSNNKVDGDEPKVLQEKVQNYVGREVIQLHQLSSNCFKINLTIRGQA